MTFFQLIIDRALVWTDRIPELVQCGPKDYDSATYHPGWKYWEEHSKVVMVSASYDKVLEHKGKIERGEVRVRGWSCRPYRLYIICADDV